MLATLVRDTYNHDKHRGNSGDGLFDYIVQLENNFYEDSTPKENILR
jgi:hypothetical protein